MCEVATHRLLLQCSLHVFNRFTRCRTLLARFDTTTVSNLHARIGYSSNAPCTCSTGSLAVEHSLRSIYDIWNIRADEVDPRVLVSHVGWIRWRPNLPQDLQLRTKRAQFI